MEEIDKDELAFLRYRQETEKFPVEMEALRTSIASNKATTELAESTKTHFEESKKHSNNALKVSVGVSILTLIILFVQTCSVQKTILEKPIELNKEKLKEMLNSDAQNNNILLKEIDSSESKILNKQESEIKRLNDLIIFEQQTNKELNRKISSLSLKLNNILSKMDSIKSKNNDGKGN